MIFKLRMTIWHKETIKTVGVVILFYLVASLMHISLINQQLPHNLVKMNCSPKYGSDFFGSWKLMAADWYWFYFLQHGVDRLCEAECVSWITWITELDPHFTSAYRLGAIHLLFYQRNPGKTISLIEKSFSSSVNAADWRLYAYMMYAYQLIEKNEHVVRWKNELKRKPFPCFLLRCDLPEQPHYLTKKILES